MGLFKGVFGIHEARIGATDSKELGIVIARLQDDHHFKLIIKLFEFYHLMIYLVDLMGEGRQLLLLLVVFML